MDLATCLHQLGAPEQLDFHVECVDLLRHASHDLSVEKTRRSYLDRIANKEFAGVLLSPPCGFLLRSNPRSSGPSLKDLMQL